MKPFFIQNYIVTFIVALTLLVLASCKSHQAVTVTKQPVLSDYSLGEKWVWKYKGVTDAGEVRSDGTDTRRIVAINGALGMTLGKDTVLVSDIVKPETSATPRYKWPLEVGKTWTYEKDWTSQDGTTGKQSQDVEVLSYKEETVGAGTFMAYTIEYKGTVSNSRGYSAQTDEVWVYAPEVKNFIRMTQVQDGFSYTEELIEYSK
ncbi:hypothetical protein [Hanstruepera ponticola]|uniref:hypothetical protein n=1 Tax=Hanstruepera ponticola TaxID=2042995 RepID=UPI00177D0A97|nr:hypothetical protein [Hanstruepera ponticola]